MDFSSALTHLGLSAAESSIYLILLQQGPLTVAGIAQHSKLHRPAVYRAIPALRARGLVALSVRGRRAYFEAEAPEKLETLIAGYTQELEQLIPALREQPRVRSSKPLVKFFEGREGLRAVFADLVSSLKRGEIFYRYSSTEPGVRHDQYLPPRYRELRESKRLERFLITNEGKAKLKRPQLERAIRYVPRSVDLFIDNVTEIVYGPKVAFIDYNSETATVIENEKLASFERRKFKLLFDRLPRG